MHTKKRSPKRQERRAGAYAPMAVLAMLCVAGSFAMGIQTAGDMQAITTSEAGESVSGDMNGNGRLDREDIAIVLEIVRGFRQPTPEQLRADPSGDAHLTLDDASRMLHDLDSL